MIRRPSLKRPPGPPPPPHRWQRVYLAHRLPWGCLMPGEESYVPAAYTVDGPTYECERCGCVRMFAWLGVTRDGEQRVEQVALHGFDWESLAPMRAPSCDVLERPGEGSVAA